MSYYVSREGQTYGPYTLDDLQRYVTTGNVLLTDMARAEDGSEWLPVAQILGGAAAPPPPPSSPVAPGYAAPVPSGYAAAAGAYPDPPNMSWVLVLVLTVVTCGIFGVIWELVQLLWLRKVEPQTKAMGYFIGYVALSFVSGGVSAVISASIMNGSQPRGSALSGLLSLAAFVLVILYRFAMKGSLEQHFNGPEPIGLRLGPIMTFFFGGLYFQYHFNRINEIKQATRYRGY